MKEQIAAGVAGKAQLRENSQARLFRRCLTQHFHNGRGIFLHVAQAQLGHGRGYAHQSFHGTSLLMSLKAEQLSLSVARGIHLQQSSVSPLGGAGVEQQNTVPFLQGGTVRVAKEHHPATGLAGGRRQGAQG